MKIITKKKADEILKRITANEIIGIEYIIAEKRKEGLRGVSCLVIDGECESGVAVNGSY